MDEIAVKVEDLTIAYYLKPVVWDVDLDIKRGKLTAIWDQTVQVNRLC